MGENNKRDSEQMVVLPIKIGPKVYPGACPAFQERKIYPIDTACK